MYTLPLSFGVAVIRFRHIKDHRELPLIPPGVNLFRVQRVTVCGLSIDGPGFEGASPTLGCRYWVGLSFCSKLDEFDPDKGKIKSLREALKQTPLTRAERAAVWAAFFTASPDRESKKGMLTIQEVQ